MTLPTGDELRSLYESMVQGGKPVDHWEIVVTTSGPTVAGWYDDSDGWFHHKIEHEDGRIERFVSRTMGGELYEDNP